MGNSCDKTEKNMRHAIDGHGKKRIAVLVLLAVTLMFSVSCSLFHTEKDEGAFQQEIISLLAPEKVTEPVAPEASGSAEGPVSPSGSAQGSGSPTGTLGTNGYSVTAENFNCICQDVSGIVTQELRIVDDHLEIVDADGGVRVYEKIGENTYKSSMTGYYILIDNGQETRVEREEWIIVTLTDDGYSMSHNREDEDSPCCIHTFTQAD